MSDEDFLIVLRLTGQMDLDGTWMAVRSGRIPRYLVFGGETTTMVPTGDVEWNGDVPAEVYVPEDRLGQWQAEHQLDR